MADPRIAQHLARGQPVPSAQDQHAAGLRHPGEHGPDQGLVIAVLVAGRELQVAVEIEPEVGIPAGQDDPLVRGRAGVDHRFVVEGDLAPALQPVGHGEAGEQRGGDQQRGGKIGADPLLPPQCDQQGDGDRDIGQPEDEPGADHAKLRHQHQREQQRGDQRADIVIGQDVRDQLAEGEAVAQDADQQRDLEPHEHADAQHQGIERDTEIADQREQQEQPGGRPAAQRGDQDFDPHEHRQLAPVDMTRQPRAHPHGEQVGADHGGELGDAVAQQVAGEGPGQQFVDQPAGGDDQDRDQQDDRKRGGGLRGTRLARRRGMIIHARPRR